MKWIKLLLVLLAGLCFFEVYYLHSQLSFIDYPYLYAGSTFMLAAVILHFKGRKR